MIEVLVETNWVVACVAPEHHRIPAARGLLERAAAGEIALHLPAVCLTEARYTVLRRYRPRSEADAIRFFLRWALSNDKLSADEARVGRKIVDMFEQRVRRELHDIDAAIGELVAHPGVQTFALNDAMLKRAIELGASDLQLEPYDQAVLAAVLVRSAELTASGSASLIFCELDFDLQPWDKEGKAKQHLTRLYDGAKVWVHGDFALETSRPPPSWLA